MQTSSLAFLPSTHCSLQCTEPCRHTAGLCSPKFSWLYRAKACPSQQHGVVWVLFPCPLGPAGIPFPKRLWLRHQGQTLILNMLNYACWFTFTHFLIVFIKYNKHVYVASLFHYHRVSKHYRTSKSRLIHAYSSSVFIASEGVLSP